MSENRAAGARRVGAGAGRLQRPRAGALTAISPRLDEALALAKALGLKLEAKASPTSLALGLAATLGMEVLLKGGHAPSDDGASKICLSSTKISA